MINEVIARKNATRRLLLQHQNMSLTHAVNANEVPVSSEQSQGAEQWQTEGLQTLAPNADAREALASGGSSPSATTVSGDWYGTTTTVTSTTTVANTQSTSTSNSVPRSVFSTRVNHGPDEFVKCTFTDGYTCEVPRVAAMQMVQMQALTQEYHKEISELQIQMSQLISSTRTHLNMKNSAAPHKQKTVNFRDTFSIQYLSETNLGVHEQSAALNANKQREAALNANSQREAALNVNAQREAALNANAQREAALNANAQREAALNANAQREAALNANAQREAALNSNAQREAALNANRQHETALNADARPYRPQRVPAQTYATWQPQANLHRWRESGGRGNQPSISQSRYSSETNTLQHPPNLDIGRTVRQWKLQFSGVEGSNIEEFIERVSECRALAPDITDEDLLNAMTELTSGVAHPWCRQGRQKWQSWQDFYEDARRCYGVDKRFQRPLRKKAESRTQGRDEPLRDYIVCLRAILSKFDRPWTEGRQLELLRDNMLPRLQFRVRQEEVTSVNKLIELAREAEAQL